MALVEILDFSSKSIAYSSDSCSCFRLNEEEMVVFQSSDSNTVSVPLMIENNKEMVNSFKILETVCLFSTCAIS